MKANTSRFSWGRATFLVCGLLALIGFFAAPMQRVSADTMAQVRIIHASPFVGSADVFVDGNPLLTSFGFGAITDYVSVPAGQHKVQIALAGKGINASALTETLPPVQAGLAYTVAALGTDAAHLSLAVFVDDNRAAADTSKVRIYQLAPDGNSITATAGGKTVVQNVNYQSASSYFTLSAGAYTFAVNSSAGSLSMPVTLSTNTVTSIFSVGVFDTSNFQGEPKAELVSKSTAALPGLPQTGSNPSTLVSDGQLSIPWLLIGIATLFIAGTLFTRRLFGSH